MRDLINIVEGRGISDEWFKDGGFKTYKRPAKEKYRIADEPGDLQGADRKLVLCDGRTHDGTSR